MSPLKIFDFACYEIPIVSIPNIDQLKFLIGESMGIYRFVLRQHSPL